MSLVKLRFLCLFVIVVCLFVCLFIIELQSDHIPLWLSSPFIRPYCSLITANRKKERKSVPNCTPKTKNEYKLERTCAINDKDYIRF